MENQTNAQNQRVPVIQVSGLKKQYKLGQIGGGTLTHDLQSWWARVRGKEDPNTVIGTDARLFGKTFMALNGVDLTVYKGEALGIIGRNGAGKSTLLKILSRITAPTEGEIRLRGRVASMLEVGTGFNNEMTGRENIYMNGAILGMTRAEVDSKIDQIIEFSECGDFIDTPVKRYSSGMFVKLAFSVAAHLDSEIMVMDEVLAVGDMKFQQKCLGKMSDVAGQEGRSRPSRRQKPAPALCVAGSAGRCGWTSRLPAVASACVKFPIRHALRAGYLPRSAFPDLPDTGCSSARRERLFLCRRDELPALLPRAVPDFPRG